MPTSALLLATAFLVSCARLLPEPAPQSAETKLPSGMTPLLEQVIPVDRSILVDTLANGLRYYVRRNSRPGLRLELRLVVRAGSVLEADDQQGLARLVEHMAFRGTEHFDAQELAAYLQSIGMQFGPDVNAYTGLDQTVFELRVPTDSVETVRTAFQVLADWAGGMLLESEQIERERAVAIEERRHGRGAGTRLRDQVVPTLLYGSRYARRLPIGTKAVLDTFHHDRLRDFYRTWYRPDLMAVIAVGDCNPDLVEDEIQARFGHLSRPASPPARPVCQVPDHEEPLFVVATDPEAPAARVAVYSKDDVRDQSTVGSYRRHLIELLYHRMLDQRLDELTMLAEPPFLEATSGQSRLVVSKEAQVLACRVNNDGVPTGLTALLTEARRARVHGFSASELERERAEMLRFIEQVYRERDKTESDRYAAEYIRNFMQDEPIPGIEYEYGLYRTFLPQISLEEVNRIASRRNRDVSRVVTVSMPDRPGLDVPTQDELQAVLSRVQETDVEPYRKEELGFGLLEQMPSPGRIIAETRIEELGVTVWRLGNGVRVLLKPTALNNDQVLFSATSPGGHSLIPDSAYVPAVTAHAVVRESGVGRYDKVALDKRLAGKEVQVTPWVGALQEGLKGECSPEDVETLFELIHLYVTAPRADSTAFVSYQSWLRGMIENRKSSPQAAFHDTLAAVMGQHHFRAQPWSSSRIDRMDLESSLRVYRDRIGDVSDFTFCFVGHFELGAIRSLVCRYLGSLPASGRQERWRDLGIDPPSGVVERRVYRAVEEKCLCRLVFAGPARWSYERAFRINALAGTLRIRLREALREGLGATYGVDVDASLSHFPDGEYRVTIEFGCAPERLEELTEAVFAQIDTLVESGPDSADIREVKQIERRQHRENLQENGYWLDVLESSTYHGVDPRLVLEYGKMLDKLNAAVMRQTAARFLDRTRYVRVVLLPERLAPVPARL